VSVQGPGEKRLALLAERPGVSPDLVALEERLHAWRRTLSDQGTDSYPIDSQSNSEVLPPLESDTCLAEMIDPLPPPELLRQAADGLQLVLAESIPGFPRFSAWLKAQPAEAGDRSRADWFTASWRRDSEAIGTLAATAGIDAELLAWCGRQLCRPFFHRLGQRLAATPAQPLQTRAACPACGGPPRLARIEREESRRFLWCDLCDVQWAFKRVTCPFCGNTRHETLGYLSIEGDAAHRIDVCEVCRGYLRTVDERGAQEGARVDFLAEDVGTMHLCVVAEGRGYTPGAVGEGSDGPETSGSGESNSPV